MTTSQALLGAASLFVAIAGLNLRLAVFLKHYIDAKADTLNAKIDAIREDAKTLVDYMILHEGKIATLQGRTRLL